MILQRTDPRRMVNLLLLALAIAIATSQARVGLSNDLSRSHKTVGYQNNQNETAESRDEATGPNQAVSEYLDELLDGRDIPGVSVAIVKPDDSVVTITAGMSSVEDGTPMEPEDVLFSGSIGKTYFAALALKLVEAERLNLDDLVSMHLGQHEWFARIPNHDEITIRHLMKHQSGLPRYVFAQSLWEKVIAEPDLQWKKGAQLEYIYDAPAVHAAGDGWAYSDTNYILLAMILEELTDEPTHEVIQRELLAPHSLDATHPTISRRIEGLSQGYTALFGPFGLEGPVIRDGLFVINPEFEWGGGGYASSTSDLARWAHVYFSGRAFDGDYLDNMLDEPASTAGRLGTDSSYGLGVILRESDFGTIRGHDGVFPGYLSTVGYFPEHEMTIAIQFNTDDSRAIGKPLDRILIDIMQVVSESGD